MSIIASPMFRTGGIFLCLAVFLSTIPAKGSAEPLSKALVRKTINEVLVHENVGSANPTARQAKPGRDVLQGPMALETRRKSRSELLFQDGSVARIGSNALFSFTERARELQLGRGVMLLQVPRNSRETIVRTAGASAALTGTTVFLEQQPDQYMKLIVVEGTVTAFIPGRIGESLQLTPGKMILMPAGADRLPEPVTVNLRRLTESSGLINEFDNEDGEDPDGTETFSLNQLSSSLDEQDASLEEGTLESTDLSIQGEGTEVVYSSESLDFTDDGEQVEDGPSSDGETVEEIEDVEDPLDESDAVELVDAAQNVLPFNNVTASLDASTEVGLASLNIEEFPPVLTNAGDVYEGGIYSASELNVSPSDWYFPDSNWGSFLDFNSAFTSATGSRPVSSFKFEQLTLTGNPTITQSTSTDVSDLALVTTSSNYDLSVTNTQLDNLDGLHLLAATGSDGGLTVSNISFSQDGADLSAFSEGGSLSLADVDLASDGTGNGATLTGRASPSFGGINTTGTNRANQIDLKTTGQVTNLETLHAYVSDDRTSRGRVMNLESTDSNSGNSGIVLTSSSDLQALANADDIGGTIRLLSQGATITARGAISAENGTLDVINEGSGTVELSGLTATNIDRIKAEISGPSGTLYLNGNTTLNATESIELYASPSGANGLVEFNGDVTLAGSALKRISAATIRITPTNTVTIDGNDLIVTTDSADFDVSNFATTINEDGILLDPSQGSFTGNDGDETITLNLLGVS